MIKGNKFAKENLDVNAVEPERPFAMVVQNNLCNLYDSNPEEKGLDFDVARATHVKRLNTVKDILDQWEKPRGWLNTALQLKSDFYELKQWSHGRLRTGKSEVLWKNHYLFNILDGFKWEGGKPPLLLKAICKLDRNISVAKALNAVCESKDPNDLINLKAFLASDGVSGAQGVKKSKKYKYLVVLLNDKPKFRKMLIELKDQIGDRLQDLRSHKLLTFLSVAKVLDKFMPDSKQKKLDTYIKAFGKKPDVKKLKKWEIASPTSSVVNENAIIVKLFNDGGKKDQKSDAVQSIDVLSAILVDETNMFPVKLTAIQPADDVEVKKTEIVID